MGKTIGLSDYKGSKVEKCMERSYGLEKAANPKVKKVMDEWKHGGLHSGSKKGPKVTDQKQAIAIALSEAGLSKATIDDNYAKGLIDSLTYMKACVQLDNLLEKAGKTGEGSRGGHVIGHTRAGKPIYSSFEHEGHKEFTPEDHHDASRLHAHNLDIYSKFTKHPTGYDVDQATHHHNQSKKHFDASLGGSRVSKETYDQHMNSYSVLNDKEKKKYRSQVKTTHALGSVLNEADRFGQHASVYEESRQRHAAHKKFLDDTKDMPLETKKFTVGR